MSTEDSSSTPDGYCQCGCGDYVGFWPHNDRVRGRIKGQPKSYTWGHHLRSAVRSRGRGTKTTFVQWENALEHPKVVERDAGYDTPCWIWTGSCTDNGYGRATVNGKLTRLHRVCYEAKRGPIPDGLVPDHLCKIKTCVNPCHLELITVAVNTQRGKTAKLNAERVVAIRHLHEKGWSYQRLAKHFNVGSQAVRSVVKRKTWRNI